MFKISTPMANYFAVTPVLLNIKVYYREVVTCAVYWKGLARSKYTTLK